MLITYNVYSVIKNTYRNFMRKILKNGWVIGLLILMLVAYATPFALMFLYKYAEGEGKDMKYDQYGFSYGPTGFAWGSKSLLLFCGQCVKPDQNKGSEWVWDNVAILTILYIVPALLFFVHAYYACSVRGQVNKILNEDYLNSKQHFIIKSGKIGIVMFFVQMVNLVKEIIIIVAANFVL